MPARQPFDERHLQGVVLAQSEEIRAEKRFSGLQAFIRPVVALAGLVAIVGLVLGVKDHFGPQNSTSSAGAGTPSVEHTKATTPPKKTASARTDKTRTAAEATAAESAAAAPDGMENPLISGQSSDAGAKGTEKPNPLTAQATPGENEVALDRDNSAPNERGTIAKPGSSTCLPLPNGTQPGDVDAAYYFGWATEYCGRDLSRPSASPKVPKSQQPKK